MEVVCYVYSAAYTPPHRRHGAHPRRRGEGGGGGDVSPVLLDLSHDEVSIVTRTSSARPPLLPLLAVHEVSSTAKGLREAMEAWEQLARRRRPRGG